MKNNISLIGMPGAGKSTIGVMLAKRIGRPFIDTDLIIQENQGMLLEEIIEKVGTENFLNIEQDTIMKINTENHIIATGGSVVYRQAAMEKLLSVGDVMYLKLDYEEIESRLGDIKQRGVVIEGNKTLKDLYDERTVLYEKYANIIIDCSGKTPEAIMDEICEKLK
ncbi:shikimate kinase [Clostridium oryzae]|uniref:Shikimate kinase n=1 Tax=Clostridium oryzae TaxID=1450648 RepID=A0A1V4I6U3_9CLOT|nr:shikimate kinase [Clostridium oryzae]OPJ55686.1 shikimate kinase [Clostridium oryzae]